MPLIDTSHLLQVADRAAQQYKYIVEAFEQLSIEGSGFYYDIVTSTNDQDVEIPTVRGYEQVDNLLVDEGAPFAVRNGTRMAIILGNMDAHFNRRDSGVILQEGGWDGYGISQNVRYSDWFAQFYFAIRQRYLLAINVFSEGDDLFATCTVTGGPTLNYTDGLDYGNGADLNPANGTFFAATQLKVKVVSFGGSDLDLRLSVKDINNNPTTIDVTVPGGSAVGTVVPVGTTGDRFLDVLGAAYIAFGSFGTLGDKVEIRNMKERQISL